MNQLEIIQSQLNDINNKRVRVQTLMEQAKKQCEEIEKKYNVTSLEELQALVNKAQEDYDKQIQEAQEYIQNANQVFSTYQGIL